jgi:hypothetical protein
MGIRAGYDRSWLRDEAAYFLSAAKFTQLLELKDFRKEVGAPAPAPPPPAYSNLSE